MFEYLIFSGGGVKIGMILGAYTCLYKYNLVNKPKVIMGTSSGSLLSLCICLDYDINKIKSIFNEIDFNKFINFDIENIINQNGLDDGFLIKNLYKSIILQKNENENLTFNELYNLSKIHLIITGFNLTTNKKEYFDYHNTPDMKLIDALCISTRYPIFYTPYKYNNMYYIDGGVKNPYNITKFVKILTKNDYSINNLEHKLLGFLINSKPLKYCENFDFLDFSKNLLRLFSYQLMIIPRKYKANTIELDSKIHSMTINITGEQKAELFDCGFQIMDKHLNNKLKINKTKVNKLKELDQ
jgi:hypothetical protein